MGYTTLPIAGQSVLPPNPESNKSKTSHHRKEIISLLRKCKHKIQIQSIHADIIRNGHEQDPFITFELIRVSSKFNAIGYATKIFHYTHDPNVYIYTSLIDGFVSSALYYDAISLYFQMVENFILPDNYIVSSVLKACGFHLALRKGREIHCQIVKFGLSSNRSIRLKVVEFYGKCNKFKDAKKVFDEMPDRDYLVGLTIMMTCYLDHGLINEAVDVFNRVEIKDTVCWTAMIDGLVRNGEMNRALEFFREMQRENVKPNEVTIVCVLSACSHLGALELGKWVHSYMGKYQIKLNHFVGGALINMYSKCGDIEKAQRVFAKMEERDVTTYNSIISGLALHGKSSEAIEIFRKMFGKKIMPNSVTFVGVLNACSHKGLIDLGFKIFDSMTCDYGIEPQIEHYGCMVDLLARVGRLDEAYEFMSSMDVEPDHIMLGSLLSACKIYGNLGLGEKVAKRLINCGNAESSTYVMLSNIYSFSGKWKEAAEMRGKMKEIGILKGPGCSSIEVDNEIHEFILGDIRHSDREKIYRKLKELNERLRIEEGYYPETEMVLHDIEDCEKEWALAIHSERLAICYGLISTKPFSTIRVVKNLRVCNDCHNIIKLVAKITKRKIVVRDRNRFHHFENGICSCGDYR